MILLRTLHEQERYIMIELTKDNKELTYLTHLKRTPNNKDCRWVIKRGVKDKISEVKLIFNPQEYTGRQLLTQEQLILELELEKNKRK